MSLREDRDHSANNGDDFTVLAVLEIVEGLRRLHYGDRYRCRRELGRTNFKNRYGGGLRG